MSHSYYELLKREWMHQHPNATHEQFQAAMQRLAKKAGV